MANVDPGPTNEQRVERAFAITSGPSWVFTLMPLLKLFMLVQLELLDVLRERR